MAEDKTIETAPEAGGNNAGERPELANTANDILSEIKKEREAKKSESTEDEKKEKEAETGGARDADSDTEDKSTKDEEDEADQKKEAEDSEHLNELGDYAKFIDDPKEREAFVAKVEELEKVKGYIDSFNSALQDLQNPTTGKRHLEALDQFYKDKFGQGIADVLGIKAEARAEEAKTQKQDDDLHPDDRKLLNKAVELIERKFGSKLSELERQTQASQQVVREREQEKQIASSYDGVAKKFQRLEQVKPTMEQYREAVKEYPTLDPIKALRLTMYDTLRRRDNREDAKRQQSKRSAPQPPEGQSALTGKALSKDSTPQDILEFVKTERQEKTKNN